jgi:hypothetical protein
MGHWEPEAIGQRRFRYVYKDEGQEVQDLFPLYTALYPPSRHRGQAYPSVPRIRTVLSATTGCRQGASRSPSSTLAVRYHKDCHCEPTLAEPVARYHPIELTLQVCHRLSLSITLSIAI